LCHLPSPWADIRVFFAAPQYRLLLWLLEKSMKAARKFMELKRHWVPSDCNHQ
jgi:hypothetical protein